MAQQILSARELYHLVRRAAPTARRWPGTSKWADCGWWKKTELVASARKAVLERLERSTLPRGIADEITKMAVAVMRARGRVGRGPVSLQTRLRESIAAKIEREAERRGLPTTLDLAKAGSLALSVADGVRVDGRWTMLLHAEGWAEYSRAVGNYRASLSILGGFDDNGLWAVRVPGTISTVADGLAWLKPAAVRKAEEDGKRVLRQGDVWIVERVRDAMSDDDLPNGHRWDGASRTVRHGDHAPVHVPFAAIAIRQSTLAANGQGRRRGD